MKAKIFFADERVRDSFAALKASRRIEKQILVVTTRRVHSGARVRLPVEKIQATEPS